MLQYIIVLVIIIVWIFGRGVYKQYWRSAHRAKRFYEVGAVYPELTMIPRDDVMKELQSVVKGEWSEWPEKKLWDAGYTGAKWTVFPLIAFGRRVQNNCEKMPKLLNFIDKIDKLYGVKIALLSRLDAGMKLVPHQGWGDHSNGVLRCHYGLIVPAPQYRTAAACCKIEVADEYTDICDKCRISEGNIISGGDTTCRGGCGKCYDGHVYETRVHSAGNWIVFDDSKLHMAENMTRGERIVLILDIVRPEWVPAGTSTVEDTSELKAVIAEYLQK